MAMFDDSRYLHTKMILRKGMDDYTLAMRQRYHFNEALGTYYEWREGDTLDGVSFRQYGNTDLRWAILDANPKYKTEFDICSGDSIFIPNYDEVVDLVNVY